MQQPVELDLEEIESHLYSQVFHSTENWDQTPNHPVLNKVPEQRQVSLYSISNQPVNASRYWDGKTQTIQSPPKENITEKSTELSDKSSSTITEKPTANITGKPLTNITENPVQCNEPNQETVKRVGHVEEYIGFNTETNNQNSTIVDFSKDDVQFQQNFFSNAQDKLIQQRGIHKNNLNNNNQCVNTAEPFSDLLNNIALLEQENTKHARFKLKRLKRKLKLKQIKHVRRSKRLLKAQEKEEKRLRKLGVPTTTTNNLQSFSFVNEFNSMQKSNTNNQNKDEIQLPLINEIKEQKDVIKPSFSHLQGSFVILSDSDTDNDDVIEVPMPESEIVYIDSSSENSDVDDSDCAVDSIVDTSTINNLPSEKKTPSLSEEFNVPNSPKLENVNEFETSDINSEIQLKSEGEINIDDNTKTQTSNSINEEDKQVETEVMKGKISMTENEDKIEEIKSPQQKSNTSNTLINEIEKERAELLCTPDSNTNDFLANDVCHLNKTNFCFNFNLHQDDLGMNGKEISKSVPSITDVYETESSCSEAGTTSKNQSYYTDVDFESPIKEIFAEPDLAKFSSFITPIRNRNISNVADSTPDLTPVKTKAGTVSKLEFILDKSQEVSCNSDDSDATVLPVKKKAKKKKKKAKKKDVNDEDNNEIVDNTIETESNTETVNKNKKSKRRSKLIEELQNECLLLNESDNSNIPIEKTSKSKEKKIKKKNKRKSGQIENETLDSSNKKIKNTNICDASQNADDINRREESPSIQNAKSTEESKTLDSYFADDILYEELKTKSDISTVTDTDACDIETSNVAATDNSERNIESTNTFRKANVNETQTIDISSDSETEIPLSRNNKNSSANSSNMVLNIFSPEKEKSIENTHGTGIVAKPFSFVQIFEKLNQNKRSFKDFWTNDMSTFYNESWGHEDYDLTAVHQSMPSDFSKWSVNAADQSPTKSKKRGPMCLRCREYGHIQYRCPNVNQTTKCSTCGDEEHTYNRCPRSLCTTCRRSTQHHTTSCNNCSNYRTLRCPICNYIGHLPRDCPDLWRRYHLTTRDNNSLVVPNQMLKPPNMQWCSNCANRGHSANNCNYLRTDHFPTYPGIQSYTPVYNNIPSLLQMPIEPEVPVRIFENVNLSQITNYRNELVEVNNKKYINMIKNLRRHACSKKAIDINITSRLNHLHNVASRNQFTKQHVGELQKISKILRTRP